MSLAQIRYFVAVAEEGNVGRAAERLHIAQPPVSRQIRALEDEIGTPLFVRTPRGMQLLPSGRAFLDRARQILSAVDEASAAAKSAATGTPSWPTKPIYRRRNQRSVGLMAHSRGLVRRTAIGPENFPTLSTRDQGRFPEFLDEIHSSCCTANAVEDCATACPVCE